MKSINRHATSMKVLLGTLFLLALCFSQYATAQPAFDVTSYRFDLELFDDTDIIEGYAQIAFAIHSENVSELSLDLIGPRDRNAGTGMRVSEVKVDRQDSDFEHHHDRIAVPLVSPRKTGDSVLVAIRYAGIPADGLVISTNKFGERTFFGDNWPDRARHWLPTIDRPADKAKVTFSVVAPRKYNVVSNGPVVEQKDLGQNRRRTTFAETAPLPTKLIVIGVADFVTRVDSSAGVPVEAWVYRQEGERGLNDFSIGPRIVAWLDSLIGPFPYQKLSNVQSRTRYGGMENAGAIFYNERSVGEGRNIEGLIVHEIAHQWFGDSVTEIDWPHVWLSEGFATYLTAVYMEHRYGKERLQNVMRDARETVKAFHTTVRQHPVIDTISTELMSLLNANSYQKGAWVLHMLRREMGDTAFFAGLRAYFEAFRHNNASTSDFFDAMERSSGKSLYPVYKQWLRRPGHPVLDLSWDYDTANKKLSISLDQVQSEPAFVFPLEVRIHGASESETIEIQVSERRSRFEVSVDSQPERLILDPKVWLLFDGRLVVE